MPTAFPGAIDNFTNPTASDLLNSLTVPHATQHANVNDAIEAMQAVIGIGAGAPSLNAIRVGTGAGSAGWLTTGLTNTHIAAAAAIAYSKLSLTGGIVNADVNAAAAVALSKIAHVGSGNVLRSDGSANVGGKVVQGDITAREVTAYVGNVNSYGPVGSAGSYYNTGISVTWTVVTGEIDIIFARGYMSHTVAGADIRVSISTPVTEIAASYATCPGASYNVPFAIHTIVAPAPGSATYRIGLYNGTGGNASLSGEITALRLIR